MATADRQLIIQLRRERMRGRSCDLHERRLTDIIRDPSGRACPSGHLQNAWLLPAHPHSSTSTHAAGARVYRYAWLSWTRSPVAFDEARQIHAAHSPAQHLLSIWVTSVKFCLDCVFFM